MAFLAPPRKAEQYLKKEGHSQTIDLYYWQTNRLYRAIVRRLRDRQFLAGDYSIADMVAFPWIVPYQRQRQRLEDFPKLKTWFNAIYHRPAVIKGLEVGRQHTTQTMSEEAKKVLFGQTSAHVLAR